jgi:hypothetical protein
LLATTAAEERLIYDFDIQKNYGGLPAEHARLWIMAGYRDHGRIRLVHGARVIPTVTATAATKESSGDRLQRMLPRDPWQLGICPA